ncbi:MAG: DNA repair protein RecO [Thermodesulfobacteriota bacterium]|nr:DNA repair protein RecO [Thermodesulfobacteriota bacterium]
MPNKKTEALVIQSVDYGESDTIVTFFTKDYGKVTGIAKGAKRSRKRFGGTLDLFVMGNLMFFEKNHVAMPRIEQFSPVLIHKKLRAEITMFYCACYFTELTGKFLPDRAVNREVYHLLKTFIGKLESGKNIQRNLRIFEIRLLKHIGYQPHLDRCIACKQPIKTEKFRFSPSKGGVICKMCNRSDKEFVMVSQGTAKTLISSMRLDIEKLDRLIFSDNALKESEQLLAQFIPYQLGKEIKSARLLQTIFSST